MYESFLSIYLSCHLSLSISLPQRWTPLGGGWSHSRHHPPPRNASQHVHHLSHHHALHHPLYYTMSIFIIIIIVLNPNPKTYNTFWRPLRRPPFGDGVEEWYAAMQEITTKCKKWQKRANVDDDVQRKYVWESEKLNRRCERAGGNMRKNDGVMMTIRRRSMQEKQEMMAMMCGNWQYVQVSEKLKIDNFFITKRGIDETTRKC